MKIAAAQDFHDEVAADAARTCHHIEWALTDRSGTWTTPPDGSGVVIYVGDAYIDAFVDAVAAIAPLKWAHTEDAGIDGRMHVDMRPRGWRSPTAPAPTRPRSPRSPSRA